MVQVMVGDNLAVARLDSVTLSQELFGGPIGKDDPTIFRKEQSPTLSWFSASSAWC